jgi:hypothetical protein
MAVEDFTAIEWVEFDEGSDVTVAATTISWDDLQARSDTAYVERPWTIAADTDAEHLVEILYDNLVSTPLVVWIMYANTIGDLKDNMDAAGHHWRIDHYINSIRIAIIESGVQIDMAQYAASAATPYFLKIVIDANGGVAGKGLFTVYIYDAETRQPGDLLDTLSIEASALTLASFAAYLYALATYDDGAAGRTADGYTKNLDLQEAAGGGNPWYYHAQQ